MTVSTIEVLRLAAFTTDPSGGNPGGVVILDALPDAGAEARKAGGFGKAAAP